MRQRPRLHPHVHERGHRPFGRDVTRSVPAFSTQVGGPGGLCVLLTAHFWLSSEKPARHKKRGGEGGACGPKEAHTLATRFRKTSHRQRAMGWRGSPRGGALAVFIFPVDKTR